MSSAQKAHRKTPKPGVSPGVDMDSRVAVRIMSSQLDTTFAVASTGEIARSRTAAIALTTGMGLSDDRLGPVSMQSCVVPTFGCHLGSSGEVRDDGGCNHVRGYAQVFSRSRALEPSWCYLVLHMIRSTCPFVGLRLVCGTAAPNIAGDLGVHESKLCSPDNKNISRLLYRWQRNAPCKFIAFQ